MRFIVLLLTGLLITGTLFAQTITIINPDIHPVAFYDDNGESTGLYPDLIKEIAREEGFNLKFIAASWGKGLEMVKNNEADLMPAVVQTKERSQYLDFSETSIMTSWGQLYIHSSSDIENILELSGKIIGLNEGDQNGINFILLCREFDISCTYYYYADFGKVAQAIAEREIDGGVFTSIYTPSLTNIKLSNIFFAPVNSHFAVKKETHSSLINIINKKMEVWKKDPNSFYYKALAKYSSHQTEKKVVPVTFIYIFAAVTVLFIISFLWVVLLRNAVSKRAQLINENKQTIKESLIEKEILLKEIHHRVKNNMQIISSLLNLEKDRHPEIGNILLESINRIQAMALVHEDIYNSENFAEIDIYKYLNSLCAMIIESLTSSDLTVSFNIIGEKYLISIDQIIPIGLACSELIMNSIKHGAKDRNKLNIIITLSLKENKLYLKYSDDGNGVKDIKQFKENSSIGMELINSLVKQVDGEGESSSDNGFQYDFSFPLD